MNALIFRSVVFAAVLVAALMADPSTFAAEQDNPTPAKTQTPATADTSPKPSAHVPFHGKLSAVDTKGMTITIEGKDRKRVIHLTALTKIVKEGKPAKLEDAVVGEDTGGLLTKKDGKEEALSLRLGAKPEKPQKAHKKKQHN